MNKCFMCNKETKSEYSVNKKKDGILCGKCTKEHLKKRIDELKMFVVGAESEIKSHNLQTLKAKQADCKHRFIQYRWAIYDSYVTYECKRCKYTKKGKVVDDKRLVKRLKEIGIWENQAK